MVDLFRRCRGTRNDEHQLADVARGEQRPPCFGTLHALNGCCLRATTCREEEYGFGACGTPRGELIVVLKPTLSIDSDRMVLNVGQVESWVFLR